MESNVQPTWDIVRWLFINCISSLVCSQVHKTIYYTLGFTFWTLHFFHYFFAFVLLSLISFKYLKSIWSEVSFGGSILSVAVAEAVSSICSCIIHHGGSDGAVHSIRVVDFATTILVVLSARNSLPSERRPRNCLILIFIGVCSSLAWTDNLLYFDKKLVPVWILLALTNAAHYLLAYQAYQRSTGSFTSITLLITGSTSLLLAPFAVVFTSDSFNRDFEQIATSWEIVDYVLLVLAFVGMSGMIISKYWLICHCYPETYFVTRHYKFLLASFGQWFLQSMAHVTLFSIIGKILSTFGFVVYFVKSYSEGVTIISADQHNV